MREIELLPLQPYIYPSFPGLLSIWASVTSLASKVKMLIFESTAPRTFPLDVNVGAARWRSRGLWQP